MVDTTVKDLIDFDLYTDITPDGICLELENGKEIQEGWLIDLICKECEEFGIEVLPCNIKKELDKMKKEYEWLRNGDLFIYWNGNVEGTRAYLYQYIDDSEDWVIRDTKTGNLDWIKITHINYEAFDELSRKLYLISLDGYEYNINIAYDDYAINLLVDTDVTIKNLLEIVEAVENNESIITVKIENLVEYDSITEVKFEKLDSGLYAIDGLKDTSQTEKEMLKMGNLMVLNDNRTGNCLYVTTNIWKGTIL
jgi:hypothetical protein